MGRTGIVCLRIWAAVIFLVMPPKKIEPKVEEPPKPDPKKGNLPTEIGDKKAGKEPPKAEEPKRNGK